MERKHLQRLSGEIIYEKGVMKMEDLSQRELYLKSKEELIDLILSGQKTELAEKRTNMSSGRLSQKLDEEGKILQLMKSFNIGEQTAKKLYLQKLNRQFEEGEDGLTVKQVEEKW